MNEKQESMRYLKLAYDISFRELGPASFLTNTLSAKIVRIIEKLKFWNSLHLIRHFKILSFYKLILFFLE